MLGCQKDLLSDSRLSIIAKGGGRSEFAHKSGSRRMSGEDPHAILNAHYGPCRTTALVSGTGRHICIAGTSVIGRYARERIL